MHNVSKQSSSSPKKAIDVKSPSFPPDADLPCIDQERCYLIVHSNEHFQNFRAPYFFCFPHPHAPTRLILSTLQ